MFNLQDKVVSEIFDLLGFLSFDFDLVELDMLCDCMRVD